MGVSLLHSAPESTKKQARILYKTASNKKCERRGRRFCWKRFKLNLNTYLEINSHIRAEIKFARLCGRRLCVKPCHAGQSPGLSPEQSLLCHPVVRICHICSSVPLRSAVAERRIPGIHIAASSLLRARSHTCGRIAAVTPFSLSMRVISFEAFGPVCMRSPSRG